MADVQAQLEHSQRYGHSLAKMSLAPRQPALPMIQPKLTIGTPGDKYEQEADRVAQQVVQQLNAPKPENMQPERSVRRKTLLEELQMKLMVQRSSDGAMPASEDLENAIAQARGSGQSLPDTIREPMEQSFGADFSSVRIYCDTQADQLNRSIQARAFTTGQDLFFRQGAYQPESRDGQELIAHELTHVVQQKGIGIGKHQAASIHSHTSPISNQKSSMQVIQRDPEAADAYTPQENLSMSNFFYQHHTTHGKSFDNDTAISNHEQRSENKPNTLTNMDKKDAQREIKRYLTDLSETESQDLVNQNGIDFTTHGYYKGIETAWNNGNPNVVDQFRLKQLALGMVWKNGYYQIHHFEGRI
ncbi:MAG: DUF4157 domain-containing protein [Leptolyngbyaceae cyanobacterium SU_3_3]|nr:DUF4157 domain-containing protein [Leptolyngbyaceae cyanobacterium SU_3_3]